MAVRKMPFAFPARAAGHWNESKPEFSQLVNSASLAMPYLEPYLIRSMKQARGLITDPKLQQELDQYVAQEAQHFRQHKSFNNTLADAGYEAVPAMESLLADDYRTLGETRSLKFNLAYAEGFESMALVIGHMLIDDREYLFGNSDSDIASLVLWHFVEEIEHKNVAFDVHKHLDGGYFSRIGGLLYATGHIFYRTGQGYRALLREDGLWQSLKTRWRMTKLLMRIFAKLTPGFLRITLPWYHPSQVADPDWGLAWSQLYASDPSGTVSLDTGTLKSPIPLALTPASAA
jgi:predicted metal-dependent hydrolase